MQIESLEIQNYRLFRDAKMEDLPRMAVVVGANRSGRACSGSRACWRGLGFGDAAGVLAGGVLDEGLARRPLASRTKGYAGISLFVQGNSRGTRKSPPLSGRC